MKKVSFFILLAATAINTFSQTLTFEMVSNSTNPKKELQRKYDAYTASDGHTYHIGDDIVLGTPSSNKTFAYMTSELAMADAILNGGGISGIHAQWGGAKMKIISIKVDRSKNRGASVEFRTYLAGLGGVLVQIENCITSGEIISQGMTRNKALSELRTAKEMLELELITQQEYDSIKNICKDYIK